ncbi:hypothetical protein OG981_53470 [Streptomyces mirabilis]|jgi:hypothetical protein|uniref:hypothetical protein n=1 Tax=Streptomyces mirabilis TaxID=68239 RepID=UPI002E1E525D
MPRSRDGRKSSRHNEQHLPATAVFLTAVVLALTVGMAVYGMPMETIIAVMAVAVAVAVEAVRRLTGVLNRRRG